MVFLWERNLFPYSHLHFHIQKHLFWDLPGGPVAEIPSSQCRRPRFNPWWGNQTPCTMTKELPYSNEDGRSHTLQPRPSTTKYINVNKHTHIVFILPWWLSSKATCQCRRCRFDPWVRRSREGIDNPLQYFIFLNCRGGREGRNPTCAWEEWRAVNEQKGRQGADCLTGPYKLSLVFSVMSESLRLQGLWPAGLLCPWDFPVKNTGAGCHELLQGTFQTQWSNPRLLHLLHWQVGSFTTSAT